MQLAHEQHFEYMQVLESLGIRVYIVGADDKHPDCCFIEDTAVVVRHHAFVTRLGHQSRRGEAKEVARALRDLHRDWTVLDNSAAASDSQSAATVDGMHDL